jgi:hypothetical protein
MFFCGKNVNFLLYTLLGRSILVLSIIGLTIFNKYVGILATIIVTTLYNINDYKEGFAGENGEDEKDAVEVENPAPSSNTPYGAGTSSSPAEVAQEEANDEEEDDDEVKADDEAELTTLGQGPASQSNTLM